MAFQGLGLGFFDNNKHEGSFYVLYKLLHGCMMNGQFFSSNISETYVIIFRYTTGKFMCCSSRTIYSQYQMYLIKYKILINNNNDCLSQSQTTLNLFRIGHLYQYIIYNNSNNTINSDTNTRPNNIATKILQFLDQLYLRCYQNIYNFLIRIKISQSHFLLATLPSNFYFIFAFLQCQYINLRTNQQRLIVRQLKKYWYFIQEIFFIFYTYKILSKTCVSQSSIYIISPVLFIINIVIKIIINPMNKKYDLRYSELTNTKRPLNTVYSTDNLNKNGNEDRENQLAVNSSRQYNQKSIDKIPEQVKRKYSPNSKIQFKNQSNFKKQYSPQKSREKLLAKQIVQKNKMRSTISMNSFFPKCQTPTNAQQKNSNNLTPYFGIRKSFNPCQKIQKQKLDKPKQYTNLENTLKYLECKVTNAKKELEKKKQKRIKNQEQKCILENFQQELTDIKTDKGQQSQISNAQTINTVKKTTQLRISSLVTSVPKPKEAKPFDFNPYSPRKYNIYYVSEIVRAIHQKNSIARQHISSSIKILKLLENEQIPSYSELQEKRMSLKKKQFYKDKKTLVFDLDQTLIHCNENSQKECDVKLKINFTTGEQIVAGINIRPHALVLLNQLSKNFELIIFTASHSCYANAVLNYLDPQGKLFQHRLYRQHCHFTQSGMYVKDLRIINRNLSELVLIDNAAYSYAFQLENGIPILPYYEGSNDYELKALQSYLQKILTVKDVRQLNKKTFKLHHYTKYTNSEQLIQELYMNS